MAAPMSNVEKLFQVAVERILNGWTVLKLAVSHGMGGLDSEAKAVWMVSAVDQWFSENSDLEVYEVEEFLADVLNHEFDTIADDGSLTEISTKLCGFYRLCQSGDVDKVREKLEQLPAAAAQNSVQSQVAQEVVDQGDIEADRGGGDIQTQSEMSNHYTQEPRQTDTHTENNDTMETEEDGWHVVKRTKKK